LCINPRERGDVRVVASGGEPGRAGQVPGGQYQVAQQAAAGGGHVAVTVRQEVFAGVQPGQQEGGAGAGQLAGAVPGGVSGGGAGSGTGGD
jgi:hypothetical protein